MASPILRQNFLDHISRHIRQSEASAVVFVRQTFVVHSQQVQDRCVQVIQGMLQEAAELEAELSKADF